MMMMLEWISEKQSMKITLDRTGSVYDPLAGFCLHGNEYSHIIKANVSRRTIRSGVNYCSKGGCGTLHGEELRNV
jgi:hypothetical protein